MMNLESLPYYLHKKTNLKAPLYYIHNEINQKLFQCNMKINNGYERCICRYCNSLATKQMLLAGYTLYFICDKCAKNITRSKMQICDDPECIFPFIRDIDGQFTNDHHECRICYRYLQHLRYGFITHFSSMDFSLSHRDIMEYDRGIILADDRAIAVHKYLKEKSQI